MATRLQFDALIALDIVKTDGAGDVLQDLLLFGRVGEPHHVQRRALLHHVLRLQHLERVPCLRFLLLEVIRRTVGPLEHVEEPLQNGRVVDVRFDQLLDPGDLGLDERRVHLFENLDHLLCESSPVIPASKKKTVIRIEGRIMMEEEKE